VYSKHGCTGDVMWTACFVSHGLQAVATDAL